MRNPPLTRRALTERLPSWGVAVLESHHAPDFEMEWRRHAFVKLMYVLRGEGQLHTSENALSYADQHLVVVRANVRNRLVDQPGKPASVYVLCLSRGLLSFDRGIEARLETGSQRLGLELANRAEALFRRLMFLQSQTDGSRSLPMVIDALDLVRIATTAAAGSEEASEGSDDTDAQITRYIRRLDTSFFEATTLDAAAGSLGVSRRTFSQKFRAATGKSWLVYVRERAIDHARRLLAETDAPITSVAFECGFGDLSSFYRTFKAATGESPGAWRRRKGAREKRA